MKKLLLPFFVFFTLSVNSQNVNLNGQIDNFEELVTKKTIPIVMPDGIKLMTDFYLPIMQDCLMVNIDIPLIGGTTSIKLIPKGVQYIIYDSINGQINPNPYQLPMIFSRTPYNKGDFDLAAVIFGLFGYTYAVQDMRGRYTSEGVYLPLYSDGWNKEPYHGHYGHILDVTNLNDPRNGNKHEDGINSINYLINDVKRMYDLDGDGIAETEAPWTNGRIGMFGASALGYNQYQAAAARKVDPTQPGLKCLMPIVATSEFFKSTGYQNGVFREQLVTGWLKGQIFTGIKDEFLPIDNDIHNNIHTSFDYSLPNKFQAANRAIDHFAQTRYTFPDGSLSTAGYYPNSIGRGDMDASLAPIDANGDGNPNGAFSRYKNMEVPMYHLTGWWDIFTDGQIETWARLRKELNPNYNNAKRQKLLIGPWAHQTIGSRTTGDLTYPENVSDILGIDVGNLSESNIPVSKVIESELVSWFRYNLNYQQDQYIGEPKAKIPASNSWTDLGLGNRLKAPASDYIIPLNDLIAFINGARGLRNFPITVELFGNPQTFTVDIPALGNPLIDGLDGQQIPPIKYVDFENDIPNVRFYVPGPVDDGVIENANAGNYWMGVDSFPMPHMTTRTKYYLRGNGTLNNNPPTTDEGSRLYVHDPDNPVRSVGGANMIVKTPDGKRDSQGQINLKNPDYAPHTIDRGGVIQYVTEEFQDTLTIAGFPVMKLYASTHPAGSLQGPTDTDFHVRIIDVYPDGREMFVTEGCVNARGRLYAKSMVTADDELAPYDDEDRDAPFQNINIAQVYEYHFQTMPIAYTFGKKHKMKVLVSSSNYTRYQSNPNLPINDGEFFRRKPGDGQSYTFNGVSMSPRIAVQRIYSSPQYPTYLSLPVFDPTATSNNNEFANTVSNEILVYPNPTSNVVNIYAPTVSNYMVNVFDITGKLVKRENINSDYLLLDMNNMDRGIYIVEVIDQNSNYKSQKKITKM
jgi:predicted acyl esterase